MRNRSGFTLMEALIAASIFGMLSVISATFFMNISQSQRTTDSYSALYEDARVIMESLANEIRGGTIDYEEYFNIDYTKLDQKYYGTNRGVYSSRFYDPGYKYNSGNPTQGSNPVDLGAECLDATGVVACPGVMTYNLSVDKDMGKNPYNSVTGVEASAMESNIQTELYLISKDGRSKTIIINQKINSTDKALSILRLSGEDTDSNGVVDGFFCTMTSPENYCTAATTIPPFNDANKYVAKQYNPEDAFDLTTSPFTPISPLRSSVSNLYFIINPKEDPYKAFDESDVQYHPTVTIVMTLEPSTKEKANLPSNQQSQSITVQTTVAAGLTSRLKTYPPTSSLNWIYDNSLVDSI